MGSVWTTVTARLGDHAEELLVVACDEGLTRLGFAPFTAPAGSVRDDDHPVLAVARHQLAAYFVGEREDFDLPLAPPGSAFRQQVWARLREIPYGTTTTYGAIARGLGLTGHGARAVGLANGSNPIAVVVPCHRVVGSDGKLTGYAGGLDRKRGAARAGAQRAVLTARSGLC